MYLSNGSCKVPEATIDMKFLWEGESERETDYPCFRRRLAPLLWVIQPVMCWSHYELYAVEHPILRHRRREWPMLSVSTEHLDTPNSYTFNAYRAFDCYWSIEDLTRWVACPWCDDRERFYPKRPYWIHTEWWFFVLVLIRLPRGSPEHLFKQKYASTCASAVTTHLLLLDQIWLVNL